MSDQGGKCKQFSKVILVPLNGVHPLLYHFEMALLSTALDLKKDVIKLMKKHNIRIKCLLNGYLKQIERNLVNNNTDNGNYLYIAPIEIINLCGCFYDEFYSITINSKTENLTVFANTNWPRNTLKHIPNNAQIYSNYIANDNYIVHELMDDSILDQIFQSNTMKNEYYRFYMQFEVNHQNVPYVLNIKLPIKTIIDKSIVMNMINDQIYPFMKKQVQEPFEIFIGSKALNNVDSIFITNKSRTDTYCIFVIENDEDKERVLMNDISNQHNLSSSHEIRMKWSQEGFDAFNSDIFKNPIDTLKNHVNAIEFQDDETDTINQIENMFD